MIALNCSSFIAPVPWRSRERILGPKYAPRCRMYVLAHAFRLSQITACDIAGDGDIIATPSVPGRSPPNGSERCMRGLMSLLPRQTLVLSVELSSLPRGRSCRNQFEAVAEITCSHCNAGLLCIGRSSGLSIPGFAGPCALASLYRYLQGAWPFGIIEVICPPSPFGAGKREWRNQSSPLSAL
jgi:hypothetical protein